MIKLVVTDMDGTLLNKKTGISKKNRLAIQSLKDNGIEFAVASGRDYYGVYSIMDKFNIECESILGNGAQYCDKKGNILKSSYLNKSVFEQLVHIIEKHKVPYMIFTTNGFYTTYEPDYVREQFAKRCHIRFNADVNDYTKNGKHSDAPCCNLKKINHIDEFLNEDLEIIKLEAFSCHEEDIIPIKEELKNIPTISYLSSFMDNVEITDEKAQKGYILKEVISDKGILEDEVAVLGDGMNDYTLFSEFKYSFAPANSVDPIKEMAYLVVKDCMEDGFAEAIEHILNKNL